MKKPFQQQHARVQRNYDRLSAWYDLFSGPEAAISEKSLDDLNARSGDRILEIGYGTGRLLPVLASQVGLEGQIVGIDLSPRMAKAARSRLVQAKQTSHSLITIGDAVWLPYADNTFDGIISTFMIELFEGEEIHSLLGECYRVLKNGGRMVIASLYKPETQNPMVSVYEWLHHTFPNILDCHPIETEQIISQAGFEVFEHKVVFLWGLPVGIALGRKQ